MREVTQDEAVGGPNDEVHLVFFLGVSFLTGWLNLAEWIALTILVIYFAIYFIWINRKLEDEKEGKKFIMYGGVLFVIWMIERWIF